MVQISENRRVGLGSSWVCTVCKLSRREEGMAVGESGCLWRSHRG